MDRTSSILSVEYAVGRIARSRRLSEWLFAHPEYDARLADGGCFVKRRGSSPGDEGAVGEEYVSRVDCGGSSDLRGASPEVCRDLQAFLYGEDESSRRPGRSS
jgi:hypothetical protein